jgi:hypothetical protein
VVNLLGLLWSLNITLESLTLFFSLILIHGFLGGFRRTRSKFTVGLTALSLMLAAQAAASIYSYAYFSGHYGANLGLPLLVMSSLELLVVTVLFYLSYQ